MVVDLVVLKVASSVVVKVDWKAEKTVALSDVQLVVVMVAWWAVCLVVMTVVVKVDLVMINRERNTKLRG